ncbi:MAG TPA: hypothetical protein P5186_14180 [Candidatus Paceibacterota bacterium]|nr:hypothetical protein [Candidatus Paceibacterota bacterium]
MADAYFLYDTAGAGLNWNAVGYATSPFALDYWVEYEMQFLVTVTDYAAASWTWTSPVVGPDATGTMVSPELSVWQGAGINLGAIYSIEIYLDANIPGSDVWIDNFRVGGPDVSVPDPGASVGMFVLGLGALAICRRWNGKG